MDAELKENLAAMSCEFQDSENDEYSPQPEKEVGDSKIGDVLEKQDETPPPSNIPLITEHIISVSKEKQPSANDSLLSFFSSVYLFGYCIFRSLVNRWIKKNVSEIRNVLKL
jgi:hypothetical protein